MTAVHVGVFGGTFNPIHFGHLRSAVELRERLGFDEIRFMPAALPPHRPEPACPAQLRADLVSLAIAGELGLVCDRRELSRSGPSYTFDSLQEIRQELGVAASVCLIVGADAVVGLSGWHRWRELLNLAHVVVMARPGWPLPDSGEICNWMQQHLAADATALRHSPCGSVLVARLRPLDISASEIRRMLAQQCSPRYLLPDVVWQRIQTEELYGYAKK